MDYPACHSAHHDVAKSESYTPLCTPNRSQHHWSGQSLSTYQTSELRLSASAPAGMRMARCVCITKTSWWSSQSKERSSRGVPMTLQFLLHDMSHPWGEKEGNRSTNMQISGRAVWKAGQQAHQQEGGVVGSPASTQSLAHVTPFLQNDFRQEILISEFCFRALTAKSCKSPRSLHWNKSNFDILSASDESPTRPPWEKGLLQEGGSRGSYLNMLPWNFFSALLHNVLVGALSE